MSVLLTGAAGLVGRSLHERLPAFGWDVRAFDRVGVPGGIVGDINSPTELDAAMRGVTAVAHFAGHPREAPWPVVRAANVDGVLAVFEAARRAGVRRVVLASSIHAAGFTPVRAGITTDEAPRPDTLYGVTKVFDEALGRYYVDRYGMQVACLRLGTFAERPTDPRSLATWLSPGDCARLVDACLRAPDLDYAVAWGVSANSRGILDLASARALGYEPQDDADDYAAALGQAAPDPSDGLVGGGFTSPGFGIDEVQERWPEHA